MLARGVAREKEGCMAPATAQQLASTALDAVRLAGWAVHAAGPTQPGQRCALVYLRVDIGTIDIIADPRQG
jgi:hypothetical protein